jgi:chaperonin cofactor prefoldin
MGGEHAKAVASYSQALALGAGAATDAERATVLCNRAQCFLKTRENDKAVADCTAALQLAPGLLKALYRRAAALEAARKPREALADYRAVLAQDSKQADAAAGVRRCQADLGESVSGAGVGSAVSTRPPLAPGGGGGRGGGGVVISEEDRRLVEEAQTRVKEVNRQRLRAEEQQKAAVLEKRRAELTLEQLAPLADDGGDEAAMRLFRGVGRMFVRTPKAAIVRELETQAEKSERRLQVCRTTLEHLQAKVKEADQNFLETAAMIRRKFA